MDKDKRIAVMVLCPSPDSITYIKVVAALMVKKTRMPREKKKTTFGMSTDRFSYIRFCQEWNWNKRQLLDGLEH